MPLKQPDAFDVQDITDFLYTSTAYTGMTDVEKRRLIKTKLDDYTFAINTSPIGKTAIETILGSGTDTPDEVQGPAVAEGVVWVRAHYDGTTKTAKIKQGKPVCIDMTNGFCVTGIDETWGTDEYKVVGVALKDYEVVGTIAKIPVRLIPPIPLVETPSSGIIVLNNTLPAADWNAAPIFPNLPYFFPDIPVGSFSASSLGLLYFLNEIVPSQWKYELSQPNLITVFNPLPFSYPPGFAVKGLKHRGAWMAAGPAGQQNHCSADGQGGAANGSFNLNWRVESVSHIGNIFSLSGDSLTVIAPIGTVIPGIRFRFEWIVFDLIAQAQTLFTPMADVRVTVNGSSLNYLNPSSMVANIGNTNSDFAETYLKTGDVVRLTLNPHAKTFNVSAKGRLKITPIVDMLSIA